MVKEDRKRQRKGRRRKGEETPNLSMKRSVLLPENLRTCFEPSV